MPITTYFLRPFALLLSAAIALPQTSQNAAQQNAPQQPDSGGVKFETTLQLVVEMVSVTDKSGKTVEGLTAKDFTVTEDGKPQEIRFCEYQKLADEAPAPPPAASSPTAAASPSAAAPPAAAAPRVSEVGGMTQHQIAPEKPGEIGHRDRRMLAIYFDMSAMPEPDQLRAISYAEKFIKTQMKPPDLMALMKYDGGSVSVLTDFTDDRDLLQQTLEKLVVGTGQGFNDTDDDDSSADVGTAFGQDNSEFNIFNTDRQLAAIETAAKMLGNLNEKKALIYFASGLRPQGINNQAQMQALTNAAIRANVLLFPVDARGLVASAPMGDATQGSPGGSGMYSGSSALAAQANFARTQDTLWTLAADTGGKALLDNNDLSLGIVQAEQAISSYYAIGYYTTNTNLDGKFRRIKITLNNNLAAGLNYRQGYYAGKTFNKFNTADRERQLEDAFMLGDPITDLTIRMEVNYFQLNRAEYFVPVAVKVPGSELALARHGGAEHTVIAFMTEIKDEYGATVTNVRDKVDIKLTGETAGHPIQYETGFTLLPGTYTLKTLARDEETGRIGTFIFKFTIPNLNKEEKRIPISSVVLSSQRQAVRDAVYNAGRGSLQAAAQATDPLVEGGMKLIPSVTRVFNKKSDLYVYLQAYERGATTTQPLLAYVTFYRGKTKAFETAPVSVTDGLDAKSKAVPLRFSFPLSQLPAGRYNCQVSVIDPATQKAAFWQAPVMLLP
ncbi:MAG: VWA domain-containing protein [Bryobacteraceae bacterium]|jgi:VWFA-related protein